MTIYTTHIMCYIHILMRFKSVLHIYDCCIIDQVAEWFEKQDEAGNIAEASRLFG